MKTLHETPKTVSKAQIMRTTSIPALGAITGISETDLYQMRGELQSNGELSKANFAKAVIAKLDFYERCL